MDILIRGGGLLLRDSQGGSWREHGRVRAPLWAKSGRRGSNTSQKGRKKRARSAGRGGRVCVVPLGAKPRRRTLGEGACGVCTGKLYGKWARGVPEASSLSAKHHGGGALRRLRGPGVPPLNASTLHPTHLCLDLLIPSVLELDYFGGRDAHSGARRKKEFEAQR